LQPRSMMAVQEPEKMILRNSTFRNIQMTAVNTTHAVIENNTFTLSPAQALGFDAAIVFFDSSQNLITGNDIIGETSPERFFIPAANGIALMMSDHNDVHYNTIFGTKNGISMLASSDNHISENYWTGPKSRQGEAGISMERWSNNNIVENNTLENAGSAILFVLQSKNNKIS